VLFVVSRNIIDRMISIGQSRRPGKLGHHGLSRVVLQLSLTRKSIVASERMAISPLRQKLKHQAAEEAVSKLEIPPASAAWYFRFNLETVAV
jgi:hypothetical protein